MYKWNVIKVASSLTQFKEIISKASWNCDILNETLWVPGAAIGNVG